MKGKNSFTSIEINKIIKLIVLRNNTPASGQKVIRQKIRNIGFYGKDDWGIMNLQVTDLNFLIESGKIKVIDNQIKPPVLFSQEKKEVLTVSKNVDSITSGDFKSIFGVFKINQFDPQIDSETKVNNLPGNYIICLGKNSKLPKTSVIPIFTLFEEFEVLYTGIASISLRMRDYKQHFKGNNAGRSTLRKSIGVLFGFKQIPRDKGSNNNKTKFSDRDEQLLSKWMQDNLIMFTLPTENFSSIELMLINHFNPPLNLKCNVNPINSDFRRQLSTLRSTF